MVVRFSKTSLCNLTRSWQHCHMQACRAVRVNTVDRLPAMRVAYRSSPDRQSIRVVCITQALCQCLETGHGRGMHRSMLVHRATCKIMQDHEL